MKRLTEKDAYWYGEECWVSAKEPDELEIDDVYMKLKEYEDAEEQGLLLRLPCKVGDYVWDLLSGYRFEVVGIEMHPNGCIIFRCGNKGTEDYASFYLDEIGERWSLSEPQGKAEAEKALAEMG